MKKISAVLMALCFIVATSFAAHPNGQSAVALQWVNSPTPSVTTHLICYGTSSGNWTLTNSVPVTGGPLATNSTIVTNLSAGFTWYFVVIAFDGLALADPSNEVSARLKPGAAKNLTIMSVQ